MSPEIQFDSPFGEGDPLCAAFPLPFGATLFPMGVPLRITTNSQDVVRAAGALWRRFPNAKPQQEGVSLQLAVGGRRNAGLQPAAPRGREHLVVIAHSPENFCVADLARGYSFGWLTPDVAANEDYLRYYFLEPLVYLMLDALYFAPVHASAVALDERAVVLCGASGAGKTTLAYACARRGWTYLSDDATHVVRGRPGCVVAGRPHLIRFRESARGLFPELASFQATRRPNGKLDIEAETESLGLSVAYERKAGHVVFLRRRVEGGAAEIRPFPGARARRIFEQVICYGDERIRAAQKAALGQLLNLPSIELSYSDPVSAEATLRRLVS